MNKKSLKREQGFTLIEIIAVLVILGILAAVAVPKFIDLQKESRIKGLRGLVAAAQSQLHMGYAENLLKKDGDPAAAWTATKGNATNICDSVSADGWLNDDVTLNCNPGTDTITIEAVYDTDNTINATEEFTNPNS